MKRILALLYRGAYMFHHWLFLRPGEPLKHARLVIVGSCLAGGAGKTPFCIWFCRELLAASRNQSAGVAIASEPGHRSLLGMLGRVVSSHGNSFTERDKALSTLSQRTSPAQASLRREGPRNLRVAVLCHASAVDEFRLLRESLPDVRVIATRNRYKVARRLDASFDVIVCDDGFEDSRLVGAAIFQLESGLGPSGIVDLFPAGRFRSLPRDHAISDLVLQISGNTPDVCFSIASVRNGNGMEFGTSFVEKPTSAICAIGDPERFFRDLRKAGIPLDCEIPLQDHSRRFVQVASSYLERGHRLVMTAKDMARCPRDWASNPDIFVAYQQVDVHPSIKNRIADIIQEILE